MIILHVMQQYSARFSTEIVQTVALPINIRRLTPDSVSFDSGLQDRQEKVQLRTSGDFQPGQSQARANGLLTALYSASNFRVSPETTGMKGRVKRDKSTNHNL